MDPTIRRAGSDDVEMLTQLMNTAFEVEQFFKNGERTTADGVRALLSQGVVLVADEAGAPVGSVYAELRGDRVYIGMVSVDPRDQGRGWAGDT